MVNLDQRLDPEVAAVRRHLRQQARLQDPRDQEDGIGAVGPGLEELHRVDDEVLAQHRRAGGGAGAVEIVQLTVEIGVRQHRDRGSPGFDVGAGSRRHVVRGIEQTADRGAPFALRDQRRLGPVLERPHEVEDR